MSLLGRVHQELEFQGLLSRTIQISLPRNPALGLQEELGTLLPERTLLLPYKVVLGPPGERGILVHLRTPSMWETFLARLASLKAQLLG